VKKDGEPVRWEALHMGR